LTDKSPPDELQEEGIAEERINQCAYCPVSPSDGTVRPGQMSDCFLDLLMPPIRACTLVFAPGAESKSMNKEIILFI
jgi:hypothetical protein